MYFYGYLLCTRGVLNRSRVVHAFGPNPSGIEDVQLGAPDFGHLCFSLAHASLTPNIVLRKLELESSTNPRFPRHDLLLHEHTPRRVQCVPILVAAGSFDVRCLIPRDEHVL